MNQLNINKKHDFTELVDQKIFYDIIGGRETEQFSSQQEGA